VTSQPEENLKFLEEMISVLSQGLDIFTDLTPTIPIDVSNLNHAQN
jgi:hypothetical protein